MQKEGIHAREEILRDRKNRWLLGEKGVTSGALPGKIRRGGSQPRGWEGREGVLRLEVGFWGEMAFGGQRVGKKLLAGLGPKR